MTDDNKQTVTQDVEPGIVQAPNSTQVPAPAPSMRPNLSPADPGHPEYDPLKDEKVKSYSNKLFTQIAERDNELKSLKDILENTNEKLALYEKEKKEKEDKDKTELQLASERLSALEKEKADLANQLENTKASSSKIKVNLEARLLLMEELSRAGIKTNSAERKGLQAELEDRLSKKKENEDSSDIAKAIVVDFGKDKQSAFTPPAEPKPAKPQKIEPTDLQKKIVELSRNYEKNKDEIQAILKQIEAKK